MNKRRNSLQYIFGLLTISMLFGCVQADKSTSNLEGQWIVKLDSLDIGESEKWFNDEFISDLTINLPSTLDEAGIGKKVIKKPELNKDILYQLTRKYQYIGPAWYQREIKIPASWEGKDIVLEMERVIWKSQVWIDGIFKGTDNSLVTAHKINLGKLVKGKHIITICIDNRQQYALSDDSRGRPLAHSYTETTQIIWNGILGKFRLTALPDYAVQNLQIYPNINKGTVKITAEGKGDFEGEITIEIKDPKANIIATKTLKADQKLFAEIAGDFMPWDEHHPILYNVEVKSPAGELLASTSFGMRKIESVKNNILLNGKRIFLRGTLDCDIFPLTGHPPLDKAGWEKEFNAAKNYGLNHLRFHSWCPPEAAFEVADSMGFYLQVEMPNWSLKYGSDKKMVTWMEQEGRRMIQNYGNHPSFCMMSLGNELEGDFNLLIDFVKELQKDDPRHLYTTTSFTFQEPFTKEPTKVDEYWTTQWTKDGWVRGQGIFDDFPPSFDKDYRSSIEFIDIPIITHEIGQYSVYPNLKEIEKYTGVLSPLNFEAIKADLKKKGRLNMADKYLLASGNLAKILYKEEIERALKTPGISGFQLLDLQDFPGQGTALVGMLDAFWDSKGIVSGDEFKEFCSDMVPLIKFEKAVYTNTETFKAAVEVADYWKSLKSPVFEWKIKMDDKTLSSGTLKPDSVLLGSYAELGSFSYELKGIIEPVRLDITVALKESKYRNSWSIWVFPEINKLKTGNVLLTSSWEEAQEALDKGDKVLLTPNLDELKGIEGKFVPVFWSPVHFPNQPGTMGLLINETHPAFREFPTEFYSNWQWWDLCKQSKTLEMDGIQAKQIVTVVDNFFKNRNLSNLFEAKVGKGLLVFSGMDLHSNLDDRITAKALQKSIVDYMNSPEFAPEKEISFNVLENNFKRDKNESQKSKKGIYDN